jgi:hypothetical protein
MTLAEVLSDPLKKRAVVADGALLIGREVGSKGGLSGLALKAGYKTVKRLKPGIIEEALDQLLPEFAPAIDPLYAKAVNEGDVVAYFRRNGSAVAEALLSVTDGKAKRANNRVMIKVYKKLRGQASGHVAAAAPGLASLIQRHVGV